jgi:hypothetical protein
MGAAKQNQSVIQDSARNLVITLRSQQGFCVAAHTAGQIALAGREGG